MSFSFRFFGRVSKVKAAIASYADSLTGQSKAELDAIVPAINTVLDQNVNVGAGVQEPMVEVNASGHASFSGDAKQYGSASVDIKPIYGQFVE